MFWLGDGRGEGSRVTVWLVWLAARGRGDRLVGTSCVEMCGAFVEVGEVMVG